MPTQTITNNPPRSESLSFGQVLKVGGQITGQEGGGAITQHGHVWNTTGTPTTADSKTQNGAFTGGVFTSAITGLSPRTKYYARAYAINTAGTAYGGEVSFTTQGSQTIMIL